MIRLFLKRLAIAAVVIGLLLSFFAAIELIRAYQVLYELHPVIGWAYSLGLLSVVLVGLALYVKACVQHKPVLSPPNVKDLHVADRADLVIYAKFLIRLMSRLESNIRVSGQCSAPLGYYADRLRAGIKAADVTDDNLRLQIIEIMDEKLKPCFEELNTVAEREVHRCVRDVMVGVAVSPWHAVDLLIVVYRNFKMVLGIMEVYDSRPTMRSQIRILVDVGGIVATVNILNFGSKLAQNIFASVPFAGPFVDDIAQGVGAGLMTSIAGHAAIDRCSTRFAWDQEDSKQRIADKAKGFAGDLKGIVVQDILPVFRFRIQRAANNDTPDSIEKVKAGLERALDATTDVMDDFIVAPTVNITAGVASGSRVVMGAATRGTIATWRGVSSAGRAVGRSMLWGSSAFKKGCTAMGDRLRRRKGRSKD